MKKVHYFTLFTLMLSLFLTSCSNLKTIEGNKKIDTQLVGVWGGEEKDQQTEGVFKKWVMTRKSDGTFNLEFTFKKGENKKEFTETGNWWIEGNVFYEFHKTTGQTDTYKYTVLDKDLIKFTMLDTALEFNSESYTFIDRRLAKEVKTTAKEKGLTMETAIKVDNVKQEYAYLKANYPNHEFISQSLTNNGKGKSYDVLSIKTKEGKTIDIYFDISSFFGKNF